MIASILAQYKEESRFKGSDNGWRWRVGSYRILGQILDDEISINIVRVGHRQGVYGHLPKL